MFEIKGKVNTAICYAKVIEDEAIEQIRRMCDYEITENSRIRIMPDAHAGSGCTIGTTMTITDKVVPNIVGVDIGCGMYTVYIGKDPIDFEKIDEAAHYIPSGMNVWNESIYPFDFKRLRCYQHLKNIDRLECSLGTLGGGNHFIEIDKMRSEFNFLVIHSGSRNLGKQVAEYYQDLAIELACGKDDYLEKRNSIINEYKRLGRQDKIQNALTELKHEYESKKTTMPHDLCFLYGKHLDDYLHDVEICQEFAKTNRELIAKIILERTHNDYGLECMVNGNGFHTIHNYIDVNEMILRKGAIAAHDWEVVVIPINMRDGSIVAVGRGNPEWNFSAPHGAGRIMSRKKAKETINLEEYERSMSGIYTTSINEGTLDEAPMAYKSIDDIIDVIRESVMIMDVMKPVYNFKASEERR